MIRSSILMETYRMKKAYQKSLALGFGIAGLMQLSIVTAAILFTTSHGNMSGTADAPLTNFVDIIRPPVISDPSILPDRIKTDAGNKIPDIGIPAPVPDNEAPVDVNIPTMRELSMLTPNLPIDEIGSRIIVDAARVFDELLPQPDVFIPVDEQPARVSEPMPIYPEVARRTGLEATIWLKALIDKEGQVRDIRVVKSNNANLGFEEAAIESARGTAWKPAISNGIPVAVWVTYAVKFKISGSAQ